MASALPGSGWARGGRRLPPLLALTLVLASLTSSVGCASDPPPKSVVVAPPPPPPPPPPPDHPATWAEVPSFYGTICPPPAFTLDTPVVKEVGGARYIVRGTEAVREPAFDGPLIIGVLGAVKDAADDTRKNLQKARKAFVRAKVNLVLLNGDVAETAEITDVAAMIGDVFGADDIPILVHAGNSEWTSGFTNAFFDLEKRAPNVFNLNFIRDLDLGPVHLLSLPGWSVRAFVKEGGCHYGDDDVAALKSRLEAVALEGKLAVITAHGPPRGPDKKSLDRTHDYGNVGDEGLAALLQADLAPFGIFGHILEAGGRATVDATSHKPLRMPQRKATPNLYVNVGSASSLGVQMLNRRTSRGMAAIVTITPGATPADARGKVTFLKLRR